MFIYKTTNLINGKIYIGQHKLNNNKYLGSGKLLKKAILKYGEKNFKREIIEYCENEEKLIDRETFWINKLDATNKKIGYNISKVGSKACMTGRTHSEESRKKISYNHADFKGEKSSTYGRKHTPSDIEKMKIRHADVRGEKNPMYGKKGMLSPLYGRKHTEESKEKISIKLKNRIIKKESIEKMILNQPKRIEIIIDGINYTSIKEAKRKLKMCPVTIKKD